MIGNREKAILHIAKRELGLEDEKYREILDDFGGVRSSIDLDDEGYRRVLNRLRELGFLPPPRTSRRTSRLGSVTAAQIRKIETLWLAVSYAPDPYSALKRFLSNRFRVNDLRAMDVKTASSVIEALKSMLKNRSSN